MSEYTYVRADTTAPHALDRVRSFVRSLNLDGGLGAKLPSLGVGPVAKCVGRVYGESSALETANT